MLNTMDQSLVQVHIPYEGFWFELCHIKHFFDLNHVSRWITSSMQICTLVTF